MGANPFFLNQFIDDFYSVLIEMLVGVAFSVNKFAANLL